MFLAIAFSHSTIWEGVATPESSDRRETRSPALPTNVLFRRAIGHQSHNVVTDFDGYSKVIGVRQQGRQRTRECCLPRNGRSSHGRRVGT